jgi:hypothetical protein
VRAGLERGDAACTGKLQIAAVCDLIRGGNVVRVCDIEYLDAIVSMSS